MTSPFSSLSNAVPTRSALRQAITDHTLAPEMECVSTLATEATLEGKQADLTKRIARKLVTALRHAGTPGIVQGLVQEYDLSTQEGVALMCLAEALLRIPDNATRDALIKDKIGTGHWHHHISKDSSIFVNAATWGLIFSGKLLSPGQKKGLNKSLANVIQRFGEPVIRQGVDMAMRLMGEQFVTGQTIEEALKKSKPLVAKGFRYSYDMLGEAATTAIDADRYYRDYETAIHAIGKASQDAGPYRGPGISVKLSALHPRYNRLQRERVLSELLPRVTSLARLARQYNIGFNIDAEEVDRLELSLDLLESLCLDPSLKGWNGLGFVVQAYQKRAPFVLDWIIALARETGRRLMIRLVKGAYWDSEIKRAQVEGLSDFPVFTRKVHTDISYLACSKKLLESLDAVFPQFATHNAQTLASIYVMAGPEFSDDRYEFQCLHGMGEALYKEVVGADKLSRPTRIYAPVGTHETLLAYLVRRLLENGANSSFVNRIQSEEVSIDELVMDPVTQAEQGEEPTGILLPLDIYQPERRNSTGLDLTNENTIRDLKAALEKPVKLPNKGDIKVLNPANKDDVLGEISYTTKENVDKAIADSISGFEEWSKTPVAERANILEKAADLLDADILRLMGILVREAGKTYANAVAEVREAVDFLRYYSVQIRREQHEDGDKPLGPVVCISPWNFPLAIFLGQISAALAVGNSVLAKPAEETSLIAWEAINALHEAGMPKKVVQLVLGAGEVGGQLVADKRVRGVLFTGSTEVARIIQKQLSTRLNPDGAPVPLIAETGGQNALIVDSSALAEQVVIDVLSSAFDSAGQRCSALRILALQEDSADRVLRMIKGAMEQLRTGNPSLLETDVGPVISEEARDNILKHIEDMRAAGYNVFQTEPQDECDKGTFVPPTIIEIDDIHALKREVFGPVLHVIRYKRNELDKLMEDINNTGYALTFGIHSRIEQSIAAVTERSHAGNVYVNRNIVGAIVGVQPFGGHGLSGTGPKAGGPLYLRRLLATTSPLPRDFQHFVPRNAHVFANWLQVALQDAEEVPVPSFTPLGTEVVLPGPVGEDNIYTLSARGSILCAGPSTTDVCKQIMAALATGNKCLVPPDVLRRLPPVPASLTTVILPFVPSNQVDIALFNGSEKERTELAQMLATREGAIINLYVPSPTDGTYPLEWLVSERSSSTNTTAAGGNAALMAAV
ncbi:bifunctional proline dehydrogenase/L-glutamate gamma-semialdehyde dehydrogenase PutA [Swingsia samuiensis]|uniref:Bifunctional protein PutA n=1 Tax=Swingsia samuiensis TaxID=1293412 RepID=A0A4Y6UNV1_9PROT|nr:bifunctional proline dehydrogenase/L-glutamate gamma-semialdehyde dehydrogenase PutA [Swingsia samuiensis]QDH17735.1 bifunctional proline dehydrogenase/L-glutamate gamma-semialdehyde dehydrogenase PutA [Swingsia samuiensis]